ncbi:MAG: transposase [Pirellulales bacterium]
MIQAELELDQPTPAPRRTQVLRLVGIAPSSWYRRPRDEQQPPKRSGPAPRAIPDDVVRGVVTMASENPWYGYKRIAVMCRRAGQTVKDRQAYVVMRDHGLLQRPRSRAAELHQTAKLFELFPQKPNDLWQMDVTYIHLPGFGWHYAVTVIDYYSRYLLACHLTHSYSAQEVLRALQLAREEAKRVSGPLTTRPFLVTDNGSSFIARRFQASASAEFSHVRLSKRGPPLPPLVARHPAAAPSRARAEATARRKGRTRDTDLVN